MNLTITPPRQGSGGWQRGIFWSATFSVLTLGFNCAPGQAAPRVSQTSPVPVVQSRKQVTPTTGNCYQTLQQVGVYEQPNLRSDAVAVLKAGTSVTLGRGSGQGWIRVAEPIVGWVEASALRVNSTNDNPCGVPDAHGEDVLVLPARNGSGAAPGQTICQVVALEGLAVRNQPIVQGRTLVGILPPGTYPFQFSDRRVNLTTNNETREWVYVLAPLTGWITTGVVETGTRTLLGQGCG